MCRALSAVGRGAVRRPPVTFSPPCVKGSGEAIGLRNQTPSRQSEPSINADMGPSLPPARREISLERIRNQHCHQVFPSGNPVRTLHWKPNEADTLSSHCPQRERESLVRIETTASRGLGFGVSNVGCRVSSVECRVSGVGCRVSSVECRVSGVGCRVSGVG